MGPGGEILSFFAPGRVNLIGEHTDYNGGHVFSISAAVDGPKRNRVFRMTGPAFEGK